MASRSISRRPSDLSILNEAGRDPERSQTDEWHVMNLRMPKWLVKEVDTVRKRRTGKVSRNQWILEAMEDKLERDS